MSLSPDPAPVPLYSRDLGGATEPPVILLHGLLGSSRNWQTAGRELASRRRIFALDLRNHGLSPHSDVMSYPAMAADVVAWMDGNGIGRAELVGHSMGGKVAMRVACRHPERVGHLVVVDIAPRDYSRNAHDGEFEAMNGLDLSRLASRAQAEAAFEARVPSWAQRKFIATNLDRAPDGTWRWLINLPVLTRTLPQLESNSIGDSDRFDGPALFIVGANSDYVRPGDRAAIRSHFPSARIETLPGVGHNPHTEAREAFVAAVASLL